MQLCDWEISQLCDSSNVADGSRWRPMLDPFVMEKSRMGSLSYGLGHFGYDIRLGDALVIPERVMRPIDPATETDLSTLPYTNFDLETRAAVLEPGQMVMGGTLEYFCIPANIVAVVHDKSTLARLGLAVQNTVLEPGWNGFLTMEITNHGVNDIVLSSGMPIAQVIFYQGEFPDSVYEGKYQNQRKGEVARS